MSCYQTDNLIQSEMQRNHKQEATYMTRCSDIANKLINNKHHKREADDMAIKEGKARISKLFSLSYFCRNYTCTINNQKLKSKNDASVSEEFASFS